MSDDYERQRRIQDDIGFKTATFVAGMAHYFSLVFIISLLPNLYQPPLMLLMPPGRRALVTLVVIAAVNAVVFAGLAVYARIAYAYAGWRPAAWRVVRNELFPFALCLALDLFV